MKESGRLNFELAPPDEGGLRPGDFEIRKIRNIYWALRRSVLKIVVTSFLAGVVVYLMTYMKEEKYTSVAKVMIDTRVQSDSEFSPGVSGLPISLTTLESEIEVLRSTDTVARVVDRLDLVDDPEFSGVGAEQGISLSPMTLIRGLKNAVVDMIKGEDEGEGEGVPNEEVLREETIRAVQGAREIAQIGNVSAVYAVRMTSEEPQKAAAIANALTEEYLEFHTQTKRNELDQSQGWLTTRIAQLQVDLNDLTSKLENHEVKQPFTTDEYATIKAERANSGRRINQVQSSIEALERHSGTLSTYEQNGLLDEAANYARENDLLSTSATINFASMDKAVLLDELKESLNSERVSLEASLQDLNSKIEALEAKQTLQIKHTSVTHRIENEIAVMETIYQDFVSQLSRRTQQDDYLEPDAFIIERARPPIEASEPNRSSSSLIGIIAVLFIGVSVVLLREIFQNRLRTTYEYEEAAGMKPAGFIPEVKHRSPMGSFFVGKNKFDPLFLQFGRKLWASSDLGMSSAKRGDEEDCKVLAGASANPDEGQSSALLLLGRLCAENNLRALIVDCDYVNSPYQYLKKYTSEDIEKLKTGESFAADFVVSTSEPNLDILPVMLPPGAAGSDTDQTPIQYLPVFEEVMDVLRCTYDLILLDTPPLLSSVEATSLLRFADGVLVFSRWNHSSRTSFESLLNSINETGKPVSAVVPTRVDLKLAKKFGDPAFVFGS